VNCRDQSPSKWNCANPNEEPNLDINQGNEIVNNKVNGNKLNNKFD